MNDTTPIYLDNNATTPADPEVVRSVVDAMTNLYANPSNDANPLGRECAAAVENAREQVAALIGAKSREIIFTAGATESCNTAIKGVAARYGRRGNHIITCLSEHKAVTESCRRLERSDFEVTWLRPDSTGRVCVEDVEAAITDRTILISIMAANNVVGTINPIAEIGRIAKDRNVIFHCDATQAIGKIPFNVDDMGVDLIAISAHKMYGPKGVGALYVRGLRPKVRLEPLLDGGGHERGLRSGTLNVPAIVGFGTACELASGKLEEESQRIAALRDRLFEGLTRRMKNIELNGNPAYRLPGTLNVSFPNIVSSDLMAIMPDIMVSASSACMSGMDDPHYVLKAMGLSDNRSGSSIRFSLGRFNTEAEINQVVEKVIAAVTSLHFRNHQAGGRSSPSDCCCEDGCCPR